jgi:hypothetical protein
MLKQQWDDNFYRDKQIFKSVMNDDYDKLWNLAVPLPLVYKTSYFKINFKQSVAISL